jgi:hypothetical protein
MITINLVGTAADAWADTKRFGIAREILGPDASFSAVAQRAQRFKELSKAGKEGGHPHPYASALLYPFTHAKKQQRCHS